MSSFRRGVVTVMVPSYNYRSYLRECVESAATQDSVETDVVIVDNGSTDGSDEVARALAEEFASVRFVRHDDNGGIICSFNRCREQVRGEFAVLLCADDSLTPGSLARSVAALTNHPDLGMVYGPALDFSDRADVTDDALEPRDGPLRITSGPDWIESRCRRANNPIRAPEVTMRSSVFSHAGPFDDRLPHTSDLHLWLRMASLADVGFLPGTPLALYRKHPLAHSAAYMNTIVRDLEQRWRAFEIFLTECADDPDRDGWERLVRRKLARDAHYLATRAYVKHRPAEMDDLLTFADRVDPDGRPPGHDLAWRLRRRLGPDASRRFPAFLIAPTFRWFERREAGRRRIKHGE